MSKSCIAVICVELLLIGSVVCRKLIEPEVECAGDYDCVVAHGACADGHCVCTGDRDYYRLHPAGCFTGEERKKIIEERYKDSVERIRLCSTDIDCHIRGTVCVGGECRCPAPKRYFLRPLPGCYTPDERALKFRTRTSEKDIAVNADNIYISVHPPHTPCQTVEECSQFHGATCQEGVCRCAEGTTFRGYGRHIGCYEKDILYERTLNRARRSAGLRARDVPIIALIGGDCDSDADCPITDSYCHPQAKFCACRGGYYRLNQNCAKITIGTPCPLDGSDDGFCRRGVRNSFCPHQEKVCTCRKSHLKHMVDHPLGESCLTSSAYEKMSKFLTWKRKNEKSISKKDEIDEKKTLHRQKRPEFSSLRRQKRPEN